MSDALKLQGTRELDWHQAIYEVIDMRSFSNLWFWIALAVTWSSAAHWVLGVPYDMVLRARRRGGQAAQDVEDMVRININRMLLVMEISGLWIVGLVFFVLTFLIMLAFVYAIEFAQAVFLLVAPMTLVMLLSLSTARKIRALDETGEALYGRLARHRLIVQAIGMVAILVTTMWGMYQNFNNNPLIG